MIPSIRRSKPIGTCSHGLLILTCAIIGVLGHAVQSLSQTPDPEAQLRARMTAYWQAMEKADFAAAAQYVDSESRVVFRDRIPKSGVGKWQIKKLEFSKDYTVCQTLTLVEKGVPLFADGAVLWPIRNEWVLKEGDWYLRIPWKEGDNPFIEVFKGQAESGVKRQPETAVLPPRPKPVAKEANEAMTQVMERIKPDPGNPAVLHFGEKGVFRYQYRNSGTSPIKVVSVIADCHCTGVAKDGYPEVAAGQSGMIEVTLDTFGMPLGPITKDINVQFSDLQYPLVIRLSVSNLPNFTVSPGAVDFGALQPGQPSEKLVRIRNDSGRAVKILVAVNSDPRLKVSLDKKVIDPNEELEISFRYEPGSPGDILDALSLRMDLEAEPLINIPVRGKIGP